MTEENIKKLIEKILKEEQEKTKTQAPIIDLQIGDIILTGRFRNKEMKVKEFGVDENGQPTVNGRSMLSFRIKKLMPKTKK